jgi:septal ring factor EnvC (AmiA/AmiB activator)
MKVDLRKKEEKINNLQDEIELLKAENYKIKQEGNSQKTENMKNKEKINELNQQINTMEKEHFVRNFFLILIFTFTLILKSLIES